MTNQRNPIEVNCCIALDDAKDTMVAKITEGG